MNSQEMELSKIIQLLFFFGAIIAVWVKVQTKLKELDMRMKALEESLKHVEIQDDRIMNKLEEISSQIFDVRLQLNNKQDRKTQM